MGAALGVVLLGACSSLASSPNADTPTGGTSPSTSATAGPSASAGGELTVDRVVSKLTSPWGIVPLDDGSLLVSERDTKQIVRVTGGQATRLRTIPEVRPGGEGGLLGLALSPDKNRLFAYYTAAADNRIVAMSWDGSALGGPTVILSGIPKGARHDGGRLLVGPDGYLYVGTGETGNSELAQDKKSLGGKILRLTVDGKPAPGNPFGTEVYSYGHRNVEGLAFDDQGRLWASEFGNKTWDELNLITKGGNYGWPLVEGSANNADLINPKVIWKTSDASPSGLAYWHGELWMAALRGQRLWEIPLAGTTPGAPKAHLTSTYGRLRSVVVAKDRDSLLLSASNTDGRGHPGPDDDGILRLTTP